MLASAALAASRARDGGRRLGQDSGMGQEQMDWQPEKRERGGEGVGQAISAHTGKRRKEKDIIIKKKKLKFK